jgi:hypothetical protein
VSTQGGRIERLGARAHVGGGRARDPEQRRQRLQPRARHAVHMQCTSTARAARIAACARGIGLGLGLGLG